MSFVIDVIFTTTIMFGFVMMGAFAASIQNMFRKEREDNIMLRGMCYVQKKVLTRLGLVHSDFNIAACSFLIVVLIHLCLGLIIIPYNYIMWG
ncbi:hypothetical protein [Roseibium sp.]|uniref:hypothetical protein n=1 Tax=Roseibium sp. TaxID=1936156 RepID=UPI003A9759E4